MSDRHAKPASETSALWRTYRIMFLFVSIMVELLWYAIVLRNQAPDLSTPKYEALYQRQARRFTRYAEEMGGLLIKVGQFLSSRVDLLPKAYLVELAKLQDRVQAAPWETVLPILETDLGPFPDHFVWFAQEPLAAASLGQVYQARLVNGDEVAVKVQRPGIDHIVRADLKALSWVVRVLSRLTEFGKTFDLNIVLREFRRLVFEELDYRRELRNTEWIRQDLNTQPHVIVPRTYAELSTERVLVMEFFRGIKIDHVDELLADGISPQLVAERVIRLYLHMVLESGVYHADPHAGNILVGPSGELILLDYGMVGSLDIAAKRNIRRLFVAVSGRDPGGLLQSMTALGMIRPEADLTRLRRRINYLLDRYYAETLDQLGHLDIPQLLRDFEAILRDKAIQVPGQFAFLGRAIAILVGLATAIYPDINLVQLFAPYAHRFVTEEAGGTSGYVSRQAQRYARTLAELPLLSAKVLHSLDQGDLQTQIQWPYGMQQLERLNASVRHLASSVYAAGFVIAGVLSLSAHPWLGRSLIVLAALIFVVSWWRGRSHH
ncbi:MAG: ABC transporter [Sulfobacillus acidophilus]|uniref:ABC transporter n=1 Tax=Sulfobacillus acidophilus TaxID=53633 RepID=A0A2T2WMM1_9FIRM|nr:MAG: ABC transporter [Sulfobacillus acidophilus]